MSRIGKKPIAIPSGIEVSLHKNRLEIKGPKRTLELVIHREIAVKIAGSDIIIEKIGKSKKAPAIWGLTRSLVSNMIIGLKDGYSKQLELQGVGYRMAAQSKKINLALGFSHPVVVDVPEGIEIKVEANILTITGADKQQVGQFAADVRALKKAEPYKGKGFRYVGEHVRRKAGKKTAK